jgi:hypothetical protein
VHAVVILFCTDSDDESDESLNLSDDDAPSARPQSSRYSSRAGSLHSQSGSDLDGSDDDLGSQAGDFDDGFDDGFSSGSGGSQAGSDVYGGRKTARQRAKEMGGDEALELMSLPNRVLFSSLFFLSLLFTRGRD